MAKTFLRLAVNFVNKNRDRFLAIKEKLGIKSGTDVLRFLVNYYYEREIEKHE